VATGGLVVVVGAVAACSRCELEVPVDVPEVVAALALCDVALFTLVARATAPRVPAAPAPRVIADTQARPLLRASCRADLEVAESFMVLQCWAGGRLVPGCSRFMGLPSGTRLSVLSVLPLNRL
jgi:hypothetical protein